MKKLLMGVMMVFTIILQGTCTNALAIDGTSDSILAGNELYALDTIKGSLYKLGGEGCYLLKQFDSEVFNEETDLFEKRRFMKPTIAQTSDGEKLYVLISKAGSPTEYNLYYFDLSSGASGMVKGENIINVKNYKAGKMVVTIGGIDVYRIAVIDTATDKMGNVLYEEKNPRYTITGMAYDQNTDKLIVATGRGIYRVVDQAMIDMSVYLPDIEERIFDLDYSCFLNGQFVFINQDTFFTSTIDQDDNARRLHFVNCGLGKDVRGFMQENPDVKVSFKSEMVWNNKEIIDSLLTQDSDTDIIQIYAGSGLSAIKNKKFYTDLSTSKDLSEAISLLYPQIREVLIDGESIVAYPAEMTAYCWSIDERLFEYSDYSFDDWDMQSWLTLVEELAEDFDVDDAKYALFPDGYSRRDLLSDLLTQYIVEYEAYDQLSFNNPELKGMLETVLNLPDAIFLENNLEGSAIDAYDDGLPPLFIVNTSFSPDEHIGFYESYEPRLVAPPVFATQHTPIARATLSVYLVNPFSKNKETAIAFLEYCAQHADPTLLCFIQQNYDHPIANQEFVEFKEDIAATITDLTSRLDSHRRPTRN